ncbi:hypothetical protein [Desulfatitalea alkaliphila]|uniref:Uncharacterized protein n=1 Tax=Desulfatitalea alkaliphila TaxID=2929485 RepID=A0AA41R009_9BACT|nr:hypothetical protein [Desulfatitalea alkaliphila]MCJ8500297.1 hypothetical protein [Desulfatitalea alkaliphila]
MDSNTTVAIWIAVVPECVVFKTGAKHACAFGRSRHSDTKNRLPFIVPNIIYPCIVVGNMGTGTLCMENGIAEKALSDRISQRIVSRYKSRPCDSYRTPLHSVKEGWHLPIFVDVPDVQSLIRKTITIEYFGG